MTNTNTATGARVEFVYGCVEGAQIRRGTVAEAVTNRWGTSYRVVMDDGGEEWAATIDPPGARGTGCRLLADSDAEIVRRYAAQ